MIDLVLGIEADDVLLSMKLLFFKTVLSTLPLVFRPMIISKLVSDSPVFVFCLNTLQVSLDNGKLRQYEQNGTYFLI